MKNISLASAACVLALVVAAPSIASAASGKHMHKRHHHSHHGHHGHHGHHAAHGGMHHGHHIGQYPRTGFYPVDLAGGVIAGAATIATAPFVALSGASYAQAPGAYDMGYASWEGAPNWEGVGWNGGRLSPEYVKRNGMVCVPGTVIKSGTGRPVLCQ